MSVPMLSTHMIRVFRLAHLKSLMRFSFVNFLKKMKKRRAEHPCPFSQSEKKASHYTELRVHFGHTTIFVAFRVLVATHHQQ